MWWRLRQGRAAAHMRISRRLSAGACGNLRETGGRWRWESARWDRGSGDVTGGGRRSFRRPSSVGFEAAVRRRRNPTLAARPFLPGVGAPRGAGGRPATPSGDNSAPAAPTPAAAPGRLIMRRTTNGTAANPSASGQSRGDEAHVGTRRRSATAQVPRRCLQGRGRRLHGSQGRPGCSASRAARERLGAMLGRTSPAPPPIREGRAGRLRKRPSAPPPSPSPATGSAPPAPSPPPAAPPPPRPEGAEPAGPPSLSVGATSAGRPCDGRRSRRTRERDAAQGRAFRIVRHLKYQEANKKKREEKTNPLLKKKEKENVFRGKRKARKQTQEIGRAHV